MKVLAINGSPRPQGNTRMAIDMLTKPLLEKGIEVEVITIGNQEVHGCRACRHCFTSDDHTCIFTDDMVMEVCRKLKDVDGLILAAPTHYAGMSGVMSTFLDRLFYISAANGNPLRHKVGVSISAVRRTGGLNAVDQMNKYLEYSEMMIPGSNYWNVIHGAAPGEVAVDEEGVQIMRILGKNMAWLMECLAVAKPTVEAPAPEDKIRYNMVRP